VEISIIHTVFTPENHLIITYWPLNSATNISAVEESTLLQWQYATKSYIKIKQKVATG
jgi:hypothetical protein